METPSAIAHRAGNGRLTVWSHGSESLHDSSANGCHLPSATVQDSSGVVESGGGYGAKLNVKLEPIVAVLAYLTQRTVGITLSREETFQTMTKHGAKIYIKTGTKQDGTILARRCRIYLNTGAYAEIGPRVAQKSAQGAAGPYEIPNVQIDAYLAYSNCIPAGAFRGFGLSQSAWPTNRRWTPSPVRWGSIRWN